MISRELTIQLSRMIRDHWVAELYWQVKKKKLRNWRRNFPEFIYWLPTWSNPHDVSVICKRNHYVEWTNHRPEHVRLFWCGVALPVGVVMYRSRFKHILDFIMICLHCVRSDVWIVDWLLFSNRSIAIKRCVVGNCVVMVCPRSTKKTH